MLCNEFLQNLSPIRRDLSQNIFQGDGRLFKLRLCHYRCQVSACDKRAADVLVERKLNAGVQDINCRVYLLCKYVTRDYMRGRFDFSASVQLLLQSLKSQFVLSRIEPRCVRLLACSDTVTPAHWCAPVSPGYRRSGSGVPLARARS
jgi:hypothetical protein